MNAIIAIHHHALKVPDIVAVIEQCERQLLYGRCVRWRASASSGDGLFGCAIGLGS